jgi:hypothetical protein
MIAYSSRTDKPISTKLGMFMPDLPSNKINLTHDITRITGVPNIEFHKNPSKGSKDGGKNSSRSLSKVALQFK